MRRMEGYGRGFRTSTGAIKASCFLFFRRSPQISNLRLSSFLLIKRGLHSAARKADINENICNIAPPDGRSVSNNQNWLSSCRYTTYATCGLLLLLLLSVITKKSNYNRLIKQFRVLSIIPPKNT